MTQKSKNTLSAPTASSPMPPSPLHSTCVPFASQVFCNRTLNMENIKAVGFDMDYTLALYNPETFENLAYSETLKKLVALGYPEEILKWKFDQSYMIRGLVIDKNRGNILKMDRHRYVKIALHGFRQLTRDERRSLYDSQQVLSYEEPNFALIDTLFSLADAYLFAQLVDLKDSRPGLISKTYLEIFRDIRSSIDLSHRDGSIKLRVAQSPENFLIRDSGTVEALQKLKKSGRKLFLLTNSHWDYTHMVMNWVCGNESRELNLQWTELFDVVITGAAKPTFFVGGNTLLQVDTTTGFLKNCEDMLSPHKFYQGGNVKQLHRRLGIASGSELLYVGDHIYGDILRSKKELGWRTMLVIEELEKELTTLQSEKKLRLDYLETLRTRDATEDCARELESQTRQGVQMPQNTSDVKNLKARLRTLEQHLRETLTAIHKAFHPVWGQLMKTGLQNSRFAAQVESYACLYTSTFSNMRHYSAEKIWRSTSDLLPHDEDLESE